MCGGMYEQICSVIVNTLRISSGIVCDGVKASCVSQIVCALEAVITAHHMSMTGDTFDAGTEIIWEDGGKMIQDARYVGKFGMKETNIQILNIMLDHVTFS